MESKEKRTIISGTSKVFRSGKIILIILLLICSLCSNAQTSIEEFDICLQELSNIYQRGTVSQEADRCTKLEKMVQTWFNNNLRDAQYAQNLLRYAAFNCLKGDYNRATILGKDATEIYMKKNGEDEVYLSFLDYLASIYSEAAQFQDVKRTYQKAFELRKVFYDVNSEAYVIGLRNIILADYNLANYTEAIKNCKTAIDICERGNISASEYATLLMYYSASLRALGMYEEALKYQLQSSELYRQTEGEQGTSYSASLTNVGLIYMDLADYKNAFSFFQKAIDVREGLSDGFQSDIASMYINLGDCYLQLGNYEKSISAYERAIEILKNTYGENHPLYATALDGIAWSRYHMAQYDEAINMALHALDVRKKVFGTNHPKYAESLFTLAALYTGYGNYNEAVNVEKEAVMVCESIYGKNHDAYAKSLQNLAITYKIIGETEKALECANHALSIMNIIHGKSHPDYASCLSTLASVTREMKEYDKAIQLYNEVIEIYRNVFGNNSERVADQFENLFYTFYFKEEYEQALDYAKESLQIRIRLFGKDNPAYASSMNNIALVYHKLGNYTKSIEAFKTYTDIVEDHVLKMFLGSNSGLRESYWNSHSVAFNDVYPSDYFDYWDDLSKEQRDFYAGDVYNKSALFAKGLLLNTELEVSKLIDETNDPEVKQIYTTLKENRDYLSKLYEMEVSKRPVSTDSIEQLSQRLELQLYQKLKSFGDFTNNLRTTWRDVQNKLKDNDLAIEFLTSTIDDDNDDRYFALIIKKGYNAPHMIPLFKGKEIKAIDKNEIYTTSALSNLLWKPMEEELDGITNVYFSPIGALHNIGIEYLPMEDGMNISEKYNLCRLSSTRQLTLEKQKLSDWNAVLYGGIQYDVDIQTLVAENRQYNVGDDKVESDVTKESNNHVFENSSIRGGCRYLPGTKVEVENISSTFDSDAIMYKKYIGVSGTEESFKSLSGTKPNVLHIATHGFYWTETDAEKIKRTHEEMQFLNSDNTDRATEEDKAMTRSGLMLAGSNRTIKGEKLPSGVDDGILTAKEISKLDFRGLDLVVLSACQTALGDISGSEGVFGLQRAFKKAGAQTLLMSLWKVNDTATEMLMSEFYQNLVLGKTKRQSFIEAQSLLRDIDPDPNHWAAFIMLDAVE